MSVPLDRLYHYLDDCVNHDLVIYRWTPHGSRKLEDLKQLANYSFDQAITRVPVICHDQEPLDYQLHSIEDFEKMHDPPDHAGYLHFRKMTNLKNVYDRTILLHSEQDGFEIEKFQQNRFIPAYYWSHAVIAQDWFRYAQHDPVLEYRDYNFDRDFLIYNRAWSGTREYRLLFAQYLIENNLVSNSLTSFSMVDNGKRYQDHDFANLELAISRTDLHKQLRPNTHDSAASADYCNHDYTSTGIEVVLETLFDDTRWHLTEKILRPIACGKPFILAATPGSLQYLRNYGFQTFGDLIDESYDQITHAPTRLRAIIQEMKRITNLEPSAKHQLYKQMHEIAEKNKYHFFTHLHQQVMSEYVENMNRAVAQANQCQHGEICAEYTMLWLNNSDQQSRYTAQERSAILAELAQVTEWLDQNSADYHAMRNVNINI
jgi:hypothetical protein